jgi:peptidoglycan biosynthesis protein MviN/MurJ (putative lipid II flippase)
VEPAVYTPVSAAANLRRAVIVSAVLGTVGVVVLSVLGHPLMGAFGLVGLGLGALNNRMLQKSVLRYAVDERMGKKQFRHGVMARLAVVTLIAIGLALLLRPDGLAVFVGLAVFQILMLVGAAVPVFRSLRTTS